MVTAWTLLIGVFFYCIKSKAAKRELKNVFTKSLSDGAFLDTIQSQLKESGNEGELEELLNGKLDEVVTNLKRQIPMAGMFLTGSLEETIKESAKAEIYKALPEVKELALKSIMKNLDFEALFEGLSIKLSPSFYLPLVCYSSAMSVAFGVVLAFILS